MKRDNSLNLSVLFFHYVYFAVSKTASEFPMPMLPTQFLKFYQLFTILFKYQLLSETSPNFNHLKTTKILFLPPKEFSHHSEYLLFCQVLQSSLFKFISFSRIKFLLDGIWTCPSFYSHYIVYFQGRVFHTYRLRVIGLVLLLVELNPKRI